MGIESSLERADKAFAVDFTHIGPDGSESDRDAVMAMLEQGYAHANSLTIRQSDHRLLAEDGNLLVATFVEHHNTGDGKTARRHTVVFRQEPAAPNGLHWLRVHETWLTAGPT